MEIKTMDQEQVVYEEQKTSIFLIISLSLACTFCLFAFIYQAVLKWGEIGATPAPSWLYIALFGFLGLCLLIIKTVKITITTQGIIIGYNKFFIQRIAFKDIEKVAMDDKLAGGSGFRIGFVRGRFRIVYNAGPPRVVISIKNRRKEIAFSTERPEAVIEIIESYIYNLDLF